MKSKNLFLLVMLIYMLGSCNYTTVCTLEKEYINGYVSRAYTYENGKLMRFEAFDSSGARTEHYLFKRNTNGDITSMSIFYVWNNALMFDVVPYNNTNGLADSLCMYDDTDGDDVGDSLIGTITYQYNGNNQVIALFFHPPGGPLSPGLTYVWTNDNLTEIHYIGGSYVIDTYSNVKSPHASLKQEFFLMYQGPSVEQSEYVRSKRDMYNSSSVLTGTWNYDITADHEGKLILFNNASIEDYTTYEYSCVNQ